MSNRYIITAYTVKATGEDRGDRYKGKLISVPSYYSIRGDFAKDMRKAVVFENKYEAEKCLKQISYPNLYVQEV